METVEYEVRDRIGFITLNRPEKRNALNEDLVKNLSSAFTKASKDNAVRAIILRANGEAFCSGADLGYLQQLQNFSFDENLADSTRLKELFLQIYTLNKVVIAQVEGHAIAGGCGLATVCDFIFSVPEAKFGYTEVKIGFIPAIVMVFLIRKIGDQRARQLLLSGSLITAEEASGLGLITKISAKDTIQQDVLDFALNLAKSNSAQAMATTKQMIAEVQQMPLAEALHYAARMNADARGTRDCKKGIGAFLNKEKLEW
ncbi:MAG TPA: enoyl-CoA hydratase-related protein [Cyclobacteriaceae bacterium]|nr:enoyl-CoA hydratase-related protein [Cyclobacteriaceae bacterium]